MKKCPYCAEEIQDEAVKCKHCGELLNELPEEKEERKQKTNQWNMIAGLGLGAAIVATLLLFMLPLDPDIEGFRRTMGFIQMFGVIGFLIGLIGRGFNKNK